jgi:hypothetical protein
MNIFAVDESPKASAQDLCDAHVVKMILESAQILCTVHDLHGKWKDWMYKPTHRHHPSVRWAAESNCNYGWLWYHFEELGREYTRRYNKRHKTSHMFGSRLHYPPLGITQTDRQTPFALAMPDEYKFFETPVDCYRAYYAAEKTKMKRFTYRGRPKPTWLEDWTTRLAA